MPFVEARGLRFHVQDLGRGPSGPSERGSRGPSGPSERETGAGAPVVMLHGLFTGSLASWWFTSAPALSRSHAVRLVDLRGHGLSDRPPTGYDTATMMDDVLALTDDLGPFSVVGHSYGGLLGLRLALAHPDRVTRLACIEAPLVPIRDRGPDGARDAPSADAGDTERRLLTETSIVADLRAEPAITDDDLRTVAAPMLFAFGSRSWCAPAAERVRRVVPDAPCHVFDGGHAIHLDARRQVADALAAFLGATGTPPSTSPPPTSPPVADAEAATASEATLPSGTTPPSDTTLDAEHIAYG